MNDTDATQTDAFDKAEFSIVDEPADVPETPAEPEAVDAPATPEPEVEAEPSPASEDNHDKKHDAVQARINKLTAQKYENQRRAEALEAENLALKQAAEKPLTVSSEIQPPQLPEDTYDQEAMQAYQKDMVAYSTQVAQSAAKSVYEQQQSQGQQARQQQEAAKLVSTYAANAVKDGVDMESLRAAEQSIMQAGLDPSVGNHIMNDRHGGKIAEYLHKNPGELDAILRLDPVSAGVKIANEIKPRALSSTPKVSNAPDPVPEITGSGALDKDDFERKYPGTEFI